jgi:hypothetical protein
VVPSLSIRTWQRSFRTSAIKHLVVVLFVRCRKEPYRP